MGNSDEQARRDAMSRWLNRKYFDWQSEQGERRSLGEFARLLGVSQGTLGHWMNGLRLPTGENVDRLGELGAEVYDILGLARPDPLLDEIRQAYDRVAPAARNHYVKRTCAKYNNRFQGGELPFRGICGIVPML